MSYGWRELDGVAVEVCDECGYDGREVVDGDAALAAALAALAGLLDRGEADRKPSEKIWSAREYVDHCVEVTDALLGYITDRLGTARVDCSDLEACRAGIATTVPLLTADQRAAVIEDVYPWPVTVQFVLLHLLHDLGHHVLDIRRGYAGFVLADNEGGATNQR
ncbi:hypothetical protein D0Z08_25505 [Nocardioides immobilis]|uniref:DinB-like domain-containing protein n=1 Tax=Nocardioides immobilis TaxID=2049295 RepID=A0A417XVG4_9ACTN|nr:hypothetical protein [Nocardioides immobilis]RHW24271.1 hypothetical protein D0Z08_25505 [Nocardioides immobilis]